jgi:choline dehydrogenase-like flavoprotein
VLAGYKAQREVTIKQFQDPDVATGSLNWDTDTTAQIFHLKPLSRGSVNINSTDPLAAPVIDLRAATDPTDFAILTAFLRKQRQLAAAPALAALGPIEMSPYGPAQTDEEILAVVRATLNPTASHECCTAPMLPKALGGVVNYQKKVYGVTGLRVADISNMPMVLAGPPTATTYAAAEKVCSCLCLLFPSFIIVCKALKRKYTKSSF